MRIRGGISLIELLIGIVIITLILAMGVPQFLEAVGNAKVRRVADEMLAGLQQARSEAIRRNAAVAFVPNDKGWAIVLPDNNGNDTTLVTRTEEFSETNIVVASSSARFTFNGRGRTTDVAANNINLSNPRRGNCVADGGKVRCLRVEISAAGTARQCDPALPNTNPNAC